MTNKDTLRRLYKPVISLAELRLKLIQEDRKKPCSLEQNAKYQGRADAYEDMIAFMNQLIEDAS